MPPMLVASLLAELGLVTWRDLGKDHLAPPPSQYLSIIVLWGGFGLLSGTPVRPVVTTLGWALVLATGLHAWTPKAPLSLAKPQASLSGFTKA